MKKSIIAAAIAVSCAVYSSGAAALTYTQYLKSDVIELTKGGSGVKAVDTTSLGWFGNGQTDRASDARLAMSGTTRLLSSPAASGYLTRWILNKGDNFALDLSLGDIGAGLDAGETVTGTKFRILNFGAKSGDKVKFKLFYTDGTQVASLADINSSSGPEASSLTDLGGGIFQMAITSQKKGSTAEFVSRAGGRLLGRIEALNYNGIARSYDYVGLVVKREINSPAPIPVPAGGFFLLSGIGALELLRRKNRA